MPLVDLLPEARRDFDPTFNSRQFSVRELLILTLLASLILTVGVVSRGSRYFDAFSSPWALASLTPSIIILAVVRFRLASPPRLVFASAALFLVSLCVPAISLQIFSLPSMFWGWQALCVSVMAIADLPQLIVELSSIEMWSVDHYGAAILMGGIANLAFILAFLTFFLARKKIGRMSLARRSCALAATLAFLLIIPLALSASLVEVYPGYGLWLTSMIALRSGALRFESRNSPATTMCRPVTAR